MTGIIEGFAINIKVKELRPYGNGHINNTFIVVAEDGSTPCILQKINTNVFKDPEGLMNNFASVTDYLREVIAKDGGDPKRETLHIIKTVDGKNYYEDEDGGCWRMMDFVENTICFDRAEKPLQFYTCALAFGDFQYKLRNYPAESLVETIPDFHNTSVRFSNLCRAVEADALSRAREVEAEIAFAKAREEFCNTFEKAYAEGRLPKRVTHNDTKLNNILFDKETGKALCVIDLDTIMPGYAINDFGDSIRFGATTAAEDEADLSKVNFDISLYELYTKGFIEGAKGGLTESELELLPLAAIMMTLECGMRFLTDYLEGDTYFKTSRPGQNLDRARNQFKLVEDMEKALPEMRNIVKKYSN